MASTTTSPTSSDKSPAPTQSPAPSPLVGEHGKTSIADSVVSKIAGIATREISGVHAMGTGSARAFGAIKERLPGSSTNSSSSQGVHVEVGERQAAIDLDIVVEYGVPIVDVSNAVRDNVSNKLERMTGLDVVEVNIMVDDIHLPDDDREETERAPERVQ